MALVFGFDGELTEERVSQWSRLIAGLDVTVGDTSSWAASAVAGQDRIISIAPGTGWGYGITIENSSPETVALDTVSSGVRHDLIAWKLDWTPQGGTVSLVAVRGGAVEAIPSVTQAPGRTVAYVRLCLARVTAGQQTPVIVKDLRRWGAQPLYAESLMAVENPRPGQQVLLSNGELWRRVGGQWVKSQDQKPLVWTGASSSWASGWRCEEGAYLSPWWNPSPRQGVANTLPVPMFGHGRVLPAGRYTIDVHVPTTPSLGSVVWDLWANPTGLGSTVSQTSKVAGQLLGTFSNGASKTFTLPLPAPVALTARKGSTEVPSLYVGGNYVDITRWGDA